MPAKAKAFNPTIEDIQNEVMKAVADIRRLRSGVPRKTRRMNLAIIGSNLAEAVEELQRLHGLAEGGELGPEEFQIGRWHGHLREAYPSAVRQVGQLSG